MGTRSAFQSQLLELTREVEAMGIQVQKAIADAIASLVNHDVALAQQVIGGDQQINDRYFQIERVCLSMIALQQPAASDLRRVASTLKVITDLERMADHAVTVAKMAVRLGDDPHIKPLIDIPAMAGVVQTMVSEALAAFVNRDKELALQMIARDDQVDHLHRAVICDLQALMEQDSQNVQQGIALLMVSQSLERIGDYATNLGEWLIYLLTGQHPDLNT